MEQNREILEKVENTFKAIDAIEQVSISPFFKDKTMQRLYSEKEEEVKTIWSWYTPKLQFATLACIVLLNVIAFTKLNKSSYDENLNQFAETYGLSSSTESSLLN